MKPAKQFDIHFDRDDGQYFAGELCQGRVTLDLEEPLRNSLKLKVSGISQASWTEGSGDDLRFHGQTFVYIDQTYDLWTSRDQQVLQSGSHAHTFSFHIPANCPPTYTSPCAKIQYTVTAFIERPWWKSNEKTTKKLHVRQKIDLSTMPFLAEPVNVFVEKTFCCFFCSSGRLSCKMELVKSGYVPGETVPVTVYLKNHSSRQIQKFQVTARITRITECNDYGSHIVNRDMITEEILAPSKFNTSKNCAVTSEGLRLPETAVTTINNCLNISVDYVVSVFVSTSGPSLGFELKLPIVVGSMPF